MATASKDNLNIGKKIKAWRKKNDLSQEALARMAEMPLTTLVKIETGVIKKPSINSVMKIAEAFKISLDDLINSKNATK